MTNDDKQSSSMRDPGDPGYEDYIDSIAPATTKNLSKKLTIAIALSYSLATLIITIIQCYLEYQEQNQNLASEVASLEETFNPPLSVAVWNLDMDPVHQTIYGMEKIEIVLGVRVDTFSRPLEINESMPVSKLLTSENNYQINKSFQQSLGYSLDENGNTIFINKDSLASEKRSPSNLFGQLIEVRFPLIYQSDSGRFLVGMTSVYTGGQVAFDRVKFGFLLIGMNAFLKALLLWIIFWICLQKWVTKPLQKMSEEAQRLNPKNIDAEIVETRLIAPSLLKKNDEIGILARSLDHLRHGIWIRNERIEDYSKNLEKKVQQGTEKVVERNQDIKSMLDNIKHGVIAIKRSGLIHDEFSVHTQKIFEEYDVAGQEFSKFLFSQSNLSPEESESAKKNIEDLFDPECVNHDELLSKLPGSMKLETRYLTKYLEIEWNIIRNSKDIVDKILVVINDNTSIKHYQQELLESQKISGLGRLVAGVAHELNTPTGIILTAASTCLARSQGIANDFNEGTLKKSGLSAYISSVQKNAQIIFDNIGKSAELIKTFKELSADQATEVRCQFDVVDYLNCMIRNLAPRFHKYNYSVHINSSSESIIYSYPSTIAQIVTHLISNAIIHGEDCPHAIQIDIDIQNSAESLLIKVTDNGKGISKENMNKIFEPFFTTRFGQGSSGLGLTIVYNLVTNKLEGKISCTSVEQKETTFLISIPLKQKKLVHSNLSV